MYSLLLHHTYGIRNWSSLEPDPGKSPGKLVATAVACVTILVPDFWQVLIISYFTTSYVFFTKSRSS